MQLLTANLPDAPAAQSGWSWTDFVGTAPAWVAALVAVVVGYFTVVNVRTARRAYVEGVWDRKVKVARLVYCDVSARMMLHSHAGSRGFIGDEIKERFGLGYFAEDDMGGYSKWTPKRDLFGFLVVVTNNSDEPVSDVHIQVLDPFDLAAFKSDGPMRVGTLPPGATRTYAVYLPMSVNPEVDNPAARVRLLFTDSAGTTWSRIESMPPEPDDSYDYRMLRIGLDQAHLYEPSMFDVDET